MVHLLSNRLSHFTALIKSIETVVIGDARQFNYRRVQKSVANYVANYVIGPPGPISVSRFRSYGNSTSLWAWLLPRRGRVSVVIRSSLPGA
jgi:hypothetical protein